MWAIKSYCSPLAPVTCPFSSLHSYFFFSLSFSSLSPVATQYSRTHEKLIRGHVFFVTRLFKHTLFHWGACQVFCLSLLFLVESFHLSPQLTLDQVLHRQQSCDTKKYWSMRPCHLALFFFLYFFPTATTVNLEHCHIHLCQHGWYIRTQIRWGRWPQSFPRHA